MKLEEAINALPDLTSRQREVVALIVQGLTYAEIGVALAISEVMAATHAARARERLGCRNRQEVVRLVWGKLSVSAKHTYA